MNDMKFSEKLVACCFVMIAAIVVPYTGTCFGAILFTAIIYFPEALEAIKKLEE